MSNNQNNNVWIGVDQITQSEGYREIVQEEFHQKDLTDHLTESSTYDTSSNRRDFLKFLGFGLGAATMASSCEIPIKRAIPYVIKPDQIVPGVATYYASSFVQGGDYCSILVKTREGRPIKIEGNSLSSVTKGGTSARAQASVLSLYDTSRIKGPSTITEGTINMPTSATDGIGWDGLDKAVMGKLTAAAQIRIVTHTILSPTTKKAIASFQAKYPNTEVVAYDPVSSAAMLAANEACFGIRAIPNYRFDRANTIVSFEADFLGTWISPVEYAAQYAEKRRINTNLSKATMSRHIQVETNMSLTGSNADNRILIKPSEHGAAIIAFYNEVARALGGETVAGPELNAEQSAKIKKVAAEVLADPKNALVISGSNNLGEQTLINATNYLLGNIGQTIDFAAVSYQRQGDDRSVTRLIEEMNSGRVDALFIMDGANPAYDIPNANLFAESAAKVGVKVSFSTVPNETLMLCDYAAPTHHFLESWGDALPKAGHYSLIQPTIHPLFNTRPVEISLLTWAQDEELALMAEQSYYAYLKKHWEEAVFPTQSRYAGFQSFWDAAVHDGVVEVQPESVSVALNCNVATAAKKVRQPANASMEIAFFETVNMGGGQYANNPWLLEMPDPITRCVWGNYLTIPVGWDGGNRFTALKDLNQREVYGEADIVEVSVKDVRKPITVIRQFGQMPNSVGLAIGYGRQNTGLVGKALGNEVGVNVYPWLQIDEDGFTQYFGDVQSISESIGVDRELACVQYHHTMGVTGQNDKNETINVDEKTSTLLKDPFSEDGFQGGLVNRSIIYQGNLQELDDLKHHLDHKREEAEKLNSHTIYPYDEYSEDIYSQGHHWEMHIDLNACTGCGACQVACVAENNVPMVGKTEVSRHHEMTWLRIDRYYYGDYENPNVVYQPMMCQHCDNAPCENVCPVAATNHSSEGLNQMTYNRCIGTRYCANNCPYKVRRFNWLDYTTADIFPLNEYKVNDEEVPYGADNLTRMVLNPDVTVRSRGVIEKCSFCVQRIQEGKLTAKREGRGLRDAEVKTACQTACPTGAIVFGDRNNRSSVLEGKSEPPTELCCIRGSEYPFWGVVFGTCK